MRVLFSLLWSLRSSFRVRADLQAEILALRHQLLVLQRRNRNHRLELNATDRMLWVWLSRWRSALLIVKPETVIAWLWFAKTLRATLQRLHLLGATSSAWDSRLIRGRRELLPTERGRETGCASALIKEKQLGRQHHSS
jgi:hypothetical protein